MIPTNEQLAEANIHIFLEHYGITNDQGVKLDFYNHPFLWDIYQDMSPTQAVIKAAQVGLSTLTNIKALWVAKNKKMDIIYSLPSAADVKEFVSGKTNRLISNNPILLKWTKDKDSIEQKRVGDSAIYFRGTWTERAALSIPADLYISDEVDRSKQDVVAQYESRLQHSQYGWRWYLSNPSSPGVGVDKLWQVSDQKHWFLKCEGCGHDWFLTMENIMNDGTKNYFGCTKCKKELNRRKGRWVKKFQDREVSGYWISLLMSPLTSADKILELKKTKSDEYFANFVLGMPYIGKGNVLTKNLLFQNLTDRINPQDSRPIIGVDTGIDIRYTIGNKYGIYYFGECKDYAELEKLMERLPTAIMVIDQGGDIIGPRKLRDRFPGRVFLCFYRVDRKTDDLVSWNDMDGSVVADRNKCVQLVVDEYTEKRMPIYGTEADWYDYWLHFSHIYRTEEENTLGVPVYRWLRSDRDDWVHATVYMRIGMMRFLDVSTTFNSPSEPIGTLGAEVRPDNTMFLPKSF